MLPSSEPAAAVAISSLRYEVAERTILDGIDLTVDIGSSLAITGPSGSGKTTLLMCMAGLLEPNSGSVRVAGTEMTKINARQRAAARLASVGVVYQFGELLPELTPLENVALPALLAGVPRKMAFTRAQELLDEVGVGTISGGTTATVSGGERQRIATARALITRPAVLLADEPTGALDSGNGEVVADLLFSLPQRFACALVVVTHNDKVASRADRRVEVVDGKLIGIA